MPVAKKAGAKTKEREMTMLPPEKLAIPPDVEPGLLTPMPIGSNVAERKTMAMQDKLGEIKKYGLDKRAELRSQQDFAYEKMKLLSSISEWISSVSLGLKESLIPLSEEQVNRSAGIFQVTFGNVTRQLALLKTLFKTSAAIGSDNRPLVDTLKEHAAILRQKPEKPVVGEQLEANEKRSSLIPISEEYCLVDVQSWKAPLNAVIYLFTDIEDAEEIDDKLMLLSEILLALETDVRRLSKNMERKIRAEAKCRTDLNNALAEKAALEAGFTLLKTLATESLAEDRMKDILTQVEDASATALVETIKAQAAHALIPEPEEAEDYIFRPDRSMIRVNDVAESESRVGRKFSTSSKSSKKGGAGGGRRKSGFLPSNVNMPAARSKEKGNENFSNAPLHGSPRRNPSPLRAAVMFQDTCDETNIPWYVKDALDVYNRNWSNSTPAEKKRRWSRKHPTHTTKHLPRSAGATMCGSIAAAGAVSWSRRAAVFPGPTTVFDVKELIPDAAVPFATTRHSSGLKGSLVKDRRQMMMKSVVAPLNRVPLHGTKLRLAERCAPLETGQERLSKASVGRTIVSVYKGPYPEPLESARDDQMAPILVQTESKEDIDKDVERESCELEKTESGDMEGNHAEEAPSSSYLIIDEDDEHMDDENVEIAGDTQDDAPAYELSEDQPTNYPSTTDIPNTSSADDNVGDSPGLSPEPSPEPTVEIKINSSLGSAEPPQHEGAAPVGSEPAGAAVEPTGEGEADQGVAHPKNGTPNRLSFGVVGEYLENFNEESRRTTRRKTVTRMHDMIWS